jgi:hypothetical protein
MDMETCSGHSHVHDTDENGDQAVCGGRRMKVCKPENYMYHFDGEYCPECGSLLEEEE